MKSTPAQLRIEAIAKRLLELGYEPDGATTREEVRTFSGSSPRLLVSGGRSRFRRGRDYVTIGPRTVCIYRRSAEQMQDFYRQVNGYGAVRKTAGDAVVDMTTLDTRDVDEIIAELEKRAEADR